MRLWSSNRRWTLALCVCCMTVAACFAQERGGAGRWLPTHVRLQFYGGMGLGSVGAGWDYGKNSQWETDILLGWVPRYNADRSHITFTAKQGFNPWKIAAGRRVTITPWSCGLYLTAIFGSDFWGSHAARLPKDYYLFSSRVQASIFAGQGISYLPPASARQPFREVALFYELSTNDAYLVSKMRNRHLSVADILRLSFGLKLYVF